MGVIIDNMGINRHFVLSILFKEWVMGKKLLEIMRDKIRQYPYKYFV